MPTATASTVSRPTSAWRALRWEGSYRHLAVTDRFPLAPPVLETGMMLPSCLGPELLREVVATADRALASLGFRAGDRAHGDHADGRRGRWSSR